MSGEETRPLTSRPAARSSTLECASSPFGQTPLLEAVQQRRVEALRVLLDAGASVHTCDKFANTPLHYACNLDDELVVQMLLRRGANPLAANRQRATPYDWAERRKNVRIIKMCRKAARRLDAKVKDVG